MPRQGCHEDVHALLSKLLNALTLIYVLCILWAVTEEPELSDLDLSLIVSTRMKHMKTHSGMHSRKLHMPMNPKGAAIFALVNGVHSKIQTCFL